MANTVDKVLNIALAEVGYLEKSRSAYIKNPNVLYEKTAGAGKDNYTKYGKEMHNIYPSVMDFPAYWCDAFVDWCFYKAYGVTTAKSLLGGNFNDYTVASCQMYEKKKALGKTPKVGAQIFFTKNGKSSGCHHTGLVYACDAKYVYTIEGNTSSGSGIVSNGGCVAKKQYLISKYKNKMLFGYPKYDTATQPTQPITNGSYVYGGIDYSAVFNPTFYANKYADLRNAGLTTSAQLFNHFINNGMRERRQACAEFDVVIYMQNYADLRSAFGTNYIAYYNHYCTNGKKENRVANRVI